MQLFACTPEVSKDPVLRFFPNTNLFEKGYVNKYYYHYYPDNPDQNAATKVVYSKYTKVDRNRFTQENYDAGYQLAERRLFEVSGDTLKMVEEISINSRDVVDTVKSDIRSNVLVVWDSPTGGLFQEAYKYEDEEYLYSEVQTASKDTIIDESMGREFVVEWTYKKMETDSVLSKGTNRSTYVQGLGYYSSIMRADSYRNEAELVEQMSIAEFERRADHGEHRVAWIDAEKSISDDSDFQLCGHELNIADYYNSTPDGRYIHTKHAMMDTIEASLDQAKLFDQNGRLVFRFVVNCEGIAGRFVAEGYDLDYQPMQFEQETVDHLFGILQKLEKWRPVVIRDEPRDAYFYITFNITDGEITDILP